MKKWLQASTIKPATYLRTSSQTAPGCPPLNFTTAFKRLGNNLEHWATAEGNLPRWCSLHCRLISLWDFSENYKRLGWTVSNLDTRRCIFGIWLSNSCNLILVVDDYNTTISSNWSKSNAISTNNILQPGFVLLHCFYIQTMHWAWLVYSCKSWFIFPWI